MNTSTQEKRLASEAADWMVRLETDSSTDCRTNFCQWLSESPAHIRAYLEMTELTIQLGAIRQDAPLESLSFGPDDLSNVIPWKEQTGTPIVSDQQSTPMVAKDTAPIVSASRRRWAWLSVAATVGILGVGLFTLDPSRLLNQHAYLTGIGEQRTIRLDDGSVVTLNTRSRMEVNLSKTARRVRLTQGEALFSVTRDATRPFQVVTDTVTVQVLGTQFDVWRKKTSTTVSVIEGNVRLEQNNRSHNSDAPTQMTAGEEARIEPNGVIVKHPIADVTASLSWRNRRLLFRETPLSEVADEFNRYNRVQIRVEGDFGDDERFTGAFEADNMSALLEFLGRDRHLSVTQDGDTVWVRRR